MPAYSMPSVGDRIELVGTMDDPHPVPTGTRGTVTRVKGGDYPQVSVKWDNGRTLAMLPDLDEWKLVTDE